MSLVLEPKFNSSFCLVESFYCFKYSCGWYLCCLASCHAFSICLLGIQISISQAFNPSPGEAWKCDLEFRVSLGYILRLS